MFLYQQVTSLSRWTSRTSSPKDLSIRSGSSQPLGPSFAASLDPSGQPHEELASGSTHSSLVQRPLRLHAASFSGFWSPLAGSPPLVFQMLAFVASFLPAVPWAKCSSFRPTKQGVDKRTCCSYNRVTIGLHPARGCFAPGHRWFSVKEGQCTQAKRHSGGD